MFLNQILGPLTRMLEPRDDVDNKFWKLYCNYEARQSIGKVYTIRISGHAKDKT